MIDLAGPPALPKYGERWQRISGKAALRVVRRAAKANQAGSAYSRNPNRDSLAVFRQANRLLSQALRVYEALLF